MTPQEFFDNLVDLYRRARIPTFKDGAIRRDRCRAVSGGLEDLLAYQIVRNHKDKYLAYIDQYVNPGAKPVMYVDVLLRSKASGEVQHFLDTKTDLGWSSEGLEELCKRFKGQVERAKKVTIKLADELGVETACRVAPDAQCHVVVATRANGRDLTMERLARIQRETAVSIYVLSDGEHPNSFSRQPTSHYPSERIAQSEFQRLHTALQ